MTLKAVIHPDESGGFWAEVPSLPGCVTQGETIDEVRDNLKEAIVGWLDAGEPEGIDPDKATLLEIAV